MYENVYSNNTIPAPRAKEVTIRVRKQEMEMALLNAEYKVENTPTRGKSMRSLTGLLSVFLSIFGLH
jgi:hypothetical protein